MVPENPPIDNKSNLDLELKIQEFVDKNIAVMTELQSSLSNKYLSSVDSHLETISVPKKHIAASESNIFQRIKNFYRNNDLFKYAVWATGLLFISTITLSIIEWDTFYSTVSEDIAKENPNLLDTLFNTFWWAVVTFTTVGYGDISPVTHLGKGLSIIIMLLNFGIVTLLGGAVASVMVAARLKGDDTLDESKFKGHLIIAGWNSFVPSTLKLIELDRGANSAVILINEMDTELINRAISGFERLEITHLSENYTKETVLKKAFIHSCNTFMIVPDETGLMPNETPDEDRTVLTALTAKSISEDIQVVSHIFNSEYISHLKRANVNEIVFTDVHIPYLLAKHVTDPGIPQLYDELIQHKNGSQGFQVAKIPDEIAILNHNKIAAFFKLKYNSLLIGYAVRKSGFSLEDQMSDKGDSFIRDMITDQLEVAGIKLSSDEFIAVELNPADDYQIDKKHSAIILR